MAEYFTNMNTKETLISAMIILFVLFILLYVFNFSFFVNFIIIFLGIGVLAGLFQEVFQDLNKPSSDNEIFAKIDRELENGIKDGVLWRKAQSMADGGNEETAVNKYVRLRFNQIKEDEKP